MPYGSGIHDSPCPNNSVNMKSSDYYNYNNYCRCNCNNLILLCSFIRVEHVSSIVLYYNKTYYCDQTLVLQTWPLFTTWQFNTIYKSTQLNIKRVVYV